MGERWTVNELTYEGTIFSVGPEIQYGNGQGILRALVVRTKGPYGEVFVPITLFGQDAKEAEGKEGCPIKVLARLVARQYEWNGETKWSLQLTGSRTEIRNEKPTAVQPGQEHLVANLDDPNLPDDIPF